MEPTAKPTVAFIWNNLGPYHVDRLEAAGAVLSRDFRVVGIEIAGASALYDWNRPEMVGVERVTALPNQSTDSLARYPLYTFPALFAACWRVRTRHLFVCNYQRLSVFFVALALRLLGRRIYLMFESKFDDSPRQLWREFLKVAFYLPYVGGMVGGVRSRDYLRWFGFRPERIELGYDAVSVDRIRKLAESPPAPDGMRFEDRHFTIVARLVAKKNIAMALEAYAQYCQSMGDNARALQICGSGPLEVALREKAQELRLEKLVFRGFIQAADVARTLASTLALILPSTEEQWGLVVNEAVAMGVPVLSALNPGARDLLVRTAVNGFVFEAENPAGLARLMCHLSADATAWRRLAEGSGRLAPLGDALQFGLAAARLIGLKTVPPASPTEAARIEIAP